MPLNCHVVNGYQAFQEVVSKIGSKKRIIGLFTGSKVASTGVSWCPDCVTAEPVVEKVLKMDDVKGLDVEYVLCFVGEREYWKDQKCDFRVDEKLKLTCVPTLLEYGKKAKRLLEGQVSN